MALEMRDRCERCDVGLATDADAYICSFECTIWGSCAAELSHACPNCSGELVPRPRRVER